jgi:protein involved in temperature-dependent protein secretion
VAVGLRLFLVDGEDTPLFEARSVAFEAAGS